MNDPVNQLMPHFLGANQAMIEKISGQSAWDNLNEQQQNEYRAEMLAKLTTDLGKDSFLKSCLIMNKDFLDCLVGLAMSATKT